MLYLLGLCTTLQAQESQTAVFFLRQASFMASLGETFSRTCACRNGSETVWGLLLRASPVGSLPT